MKIEEAYPELLEYIYKNCSNSFTQDEFLANRHLIAMEASFNGTDEKRYRFIMKEENIYKNENILDLVKNGYESFRHTLVNRLFDEHKDELELNLCPNCNKIARTPLAKQCRFCFYSWREK